MKTDLKIQKSLLKLSVPLFAAALVLPLLGTESHGTTVLIDGIAVNELAPVTLGAVAGESDTTTVKNAGAEWTFPGDITIGNAGSGTVNVEAGAKVENFDYGVAHDTFLGRTATGSGTLKISGPGSSYATNRIYAGWRGDGNITVEDGGKLKTIYDSYISATATGEGTVSITGENSLWDAYSVNVGNNNIGTLNIENGGTLTSIQGMLGGGVGGTGIATVTGENSLWDMQSGFLYVGNAGSGILNIEDGGEVKSNRTVVGYHNNDNKGTGELTVTGTNSKFISSDVVSIGDSGTGTLTVKEGGAFESGTEVYVGYAADSSGAITVTGAGSTFKSKTLALGGSFVGNYGTSGGTGSLTISDNGHVRVIEILKIWDKGTLTIDGGTVQAGKIDNSSGGTLALASGTLMVVDILGNLVNQGGVYAPGASPAISSISGDYIQEAAGILQIEIESASSFDILNIGGDAILDGTLQVDLLAGYIPTIGDIFTFMLLDGVNSISGSFANTILPTFAGGMFDLVMGTDFAQLIVREAVVSAVPLPPAMILFGAALVGLGFVGRRKKRAA